MKRVTRNIEFDEARDLLDRVPRACVVFSGEQGPEPQPVTVTFTNGRYVVAMASADARAPAVGPSVGDETVLLIDEGVHFFELRALYVRGHVEAVDSAESVPGDVISFTIAPSKVVAWDYGRLRDVTDVGT